MLSEGKTDKQFDILQAFELSGIGFPDESGIIEGSVIAFS